MARLTSFTVQGVNGLYKGVDDDFSWNRHGPEELRHSEEQLARRNVLVFGRRTYDFMAAYWPMPEAIAQLPTIAAAMNGADKIVVSNTLRDPVWGPTQVVGGDLVSAFRALKAGDGPDMTILGSGALLTFLASRGLVDAFEIMIHPVAIGAGTPLFSGLEQILDLALTDSRVFASGSVLLTYAPKGQPA